MGGQRNKEITKNILLGLGMVGVVALVAVAPGLSKVLPLLSKIDISKFNQAIKRLKKRGLVEVVKRKNGIEKLRLTREGKRKIARYKLEGLYIEKPQKWDRNWRIVIFDIPVTRNADRERLRKKIKELGFYKLQNSVFVHPYPCYEIVRFIKEFFGMKAEIEYIEAQNLESQNKLIEYFFT